MSFPHLLHGADYNPEQWPRELQAEDIRLMCIVAAPEGVQRMLDDHPDVRVYAAALDRALNGDGYILPGLGDAGDRLFGTTP